MDTYTEIKNKIRAMTGQKTPLLLIGKVESVDSDRCTCTVSVGDLKLTDVRLRSVINGEGSKLLITPKQGSYVTLIDLSGELRELEVIGYSQIEAIDIDTSGDITVNCRGNIVINGGSNDGLVKINELTRKLNQLVQQFNAHTHTVTGTAGAPPAGPLPVTAMADTPQIAVPYFDKTQYEDTKVKH